jgi:hypothetical protein
MRARFWLGMAQMFGAVVATVLLFTTGLSGATLMLTAVTTACTVVSRLLYRSPHPAGMLAAQARHRSERSQWVP